MRIMQREMEKSCAKSRIRFPFLVGRETRKELDSRKIGSQVEVGSGTRGSDEKRMRMMRGVDHRREGNSV